MEATFAVEPVLEVAEPEIHTCRRDCAGTRARAGASSCRTETAHHPVLPRASPPPTTVVESVPVEPAAETHLVPAPAPGPFAHLVATDIGQITSLFTKRKLDDETLQDLEDLLIQADLGVETALRITDTLASERYGKDVTGEDVSKIMAAEITKVLTPVAKPLELDLNHKPHVILVVGVNGTGKTTTIGKLAAKLSAAA